MQADIEPVKAVVENVLMLTTDNEEDEMDESIESRVKHLRTVERLSIRQIAQALKIGKKRVNRIIKEEKVQKPIRQSILSPYDRLIDQWYKEHPYLRAQQVYERLRSYGYAGSYVMVVIHTRKYRIKTKMPVYHELHFLPGEEAQVDWMQWRISSGVVYGFVFILAYSRYLSVRFYPRHSMEFFLDGHIEAFKEINGIPHRCRYDNLSSVVIQRTPELKLNGQFLDFSRHYRFSIHPCTPGRANEKGRVERVIRDIKAFLGVGSFNDIGDLNKQISLWRHERNKKVHRTTGRPPAEMVKEERLIAVPEIHYKPCRSLLAQVGKTGFVEFETNRYSVPPSGPSCEITAYPDHLEMYHKGRRIAVHKRIILRNQKIENPLHREKLIRITPNYKYQRIYQLMRGMDISVRQFLAHAEQDGQDTTSTAYELFRLLRQVSKEMLLSAIREATSTGICRVKYLAQLLKVRHKIDDNPVYPQNHRLLDITYEGRDLSEYDHFI
jgi:transposase